jgi:tetratricopeptide (TPR) repeat protein
LKLAPNEPTLWLGSGFASFMLGRTREAETALTRALTLQPRLLDASILLGELQYRSGRARDAIATYEAALKHAPGHADLTGKLAEWQRENQVQDRFFESRGAHFRVLFEGPADEALARRAVEMLEAAYWRVGSALTAYPPQTIDVILYTQQQFQDLTRAPAWAGGSYNGQIRVPVRGALDRPALLERVLVHEFVHAVVDMLGGRLVPQWLDEGLATYYQPGGMDEAAEVLALVSTRPRLTQLHASWGGLPEAAARVAYAHSADAVARMIDLRGAPAVVALLGDLARGAAFESAFQQRLAMSYADFERLVAR